MNGTKWLLEKLISDPTKGLCKVDNNHILQRIKEFENNINVEKPMTTCCEYVWEPLKDLMIKI
jgi:hypothetical protein